MQVVNVRHFKGPARDAIVYVGRNPQKFGFPRSLPVLGNPFVVGVHGQAGECAELYKHWLWDQMKSGNPEVLAALRSIQDGDNVGCWCAPKPCHANHVVAAAQWLRRQT